MSADGSSFRVRHGGRSNLLTAMPIFPADRKPLQLFCSSTVVLSKQIQNGVKLRRSGGSGVQLPNNRLMPAFKKHVQFLFCFLYFLQKPHFCSLNSVFLLFCSRDLPISPAFYRLSPGISLLSPGISRDFLVISPALILQPGQKMNTA